MYYSHLHSLSANLFRSSLPSAECLYHTTQNYIPNGHNRDPDCVAPSNIILYILILYHSNVCFRKIQKLILCKLDLEFFLSRCDTLIKLVISGLSQYTKIPKFWDFMLLPFSGGMMTKKTHCIQSLDIAVLKAQI